MKRALSHGSVGNFHNNFGNFLGGEFKQARAQKDRVLSDEGAQRNGNASSQEGGRSAVEGVEESVTQEHDV